MTSLLAYLVWNPNPILAHLGLFLLRWYGVLFALGFVVSTPVFRHIFRREHVSPRWVDTLTLYMVVGTVVGARLGHILFYEPDLLLRDPLEVLKIWHGGLASHGATLGIPLACWLFARRHQFDALWVLDRIVLAVGIGGACIRLGNFMNSEIGGYPSTVPWAVVFPRDTAHLLPATYPLPTRCRPGPCGWPAPYAQQLAKKAASCCPPMRPSPPARSWPCRATPPSSTRRCTACC